LISLTHLLSTYWTSTHWSTSRLVLPLLLLWFNFFVALIPFLPTLYTNDQKNKIQETLKRRRRDFFLKIIFSSARHRCRVCKHGSRCSAVTVIIHYVLFRSIRHPLQFCLMSINVRPSSPFRPPMFVHRRLSITIHPHWHTVFFKSYVLRTYVSDTIFFKSYVMLELFS
jgi:hypothetical protein